MIAVQVLTCPKMVLQCLICKASITQMHMGIDACRNCAVFYRRNARLNCEFKCKLNKGKCVQDGCVLECRKCRFELMRRIFERAKSEMVNLCRARAHSDSENNDPMEFQFDSVSPLELVSTPSQPVSPTKPTINGPPREPCSSTVSERIRNGYDAMSRSRKLAELCLRSADKYVHPIDIDNNSFPFLPATRGLNISTNQILMASLFDFASIAFPQFQSLDYLDKWHLVNGCSGRLTSIESIYRSAKKFPDDDRIFVSFTTTISHSSMEIYLSDCPTNMSLGKNAASLRQKLAENALICKRAMHEAHLTEDEFLMLMAYAFWDSETIPDEDRFYDMAISHRAQIMHQMHLHYLSRGVHNYSKRIGELFCLLITLQKFDLPIRDDLQNLAMMLSLSHKPS